MRHVFFVGGKGEKIYVRLVYDYSASFISDWLCELYLMNVLDGPF